MNDLVYIGLPREVANDIVLTWTQWNNWTTENQRTVGAAAKHALAHPAVVVEGDCAEVGEMLAEAAFPSIPSGPCTITITPKGGQSDE